MEWWSDGHSPDAAGLRTEPPAVRRQAPAPMRPVS